MGSCSAICVLGEIALAQAISPIATRLRSVVCLSVCRAAHLCTCLNSSTDLHAIRQVHLRGSNDTLSDDTGLLDPHGKGIFGAPLSQNLHLPTYDSPGCSTDQQFRVLPNYFGHLIVNYCAF